MENQEGKNTCTCSCRQDAKTFLIALLTSVIVVAVYHFGGGICRILRADSCGEEIPVCEKYVLIPVQTLPQGEFCGHNGPGMGQRHFRRGPGMNGERKMWNGGMKRPDGMHQGDPEKPAAPGKPAPAPQAK